MKVMQFTTPDVPEIRAECGCRLYRVNDGMAVYVEFCGLCETPWKLYAAVCKAALTYEEKEIET